MKFTPYKQDGHLFIAPEAILKNEHTQPFYKLPLFNHPPLDTHFEFDPQIQHLLAGKALPLNELPYTIEHLHNHYLHGMISYEQSILFKKGKAYCQRCGHHDHEQGASYHCARCQTDCTYCRHCLMMGVVKACTPLVRWTGPPLTFSANQHPIPNTLQLTSLQKIASDAVLRAMQEHTDLLVWAVCGAGKTEILFDGLSDALTQGKIIALATPRIDVVLELTPRLKLAFPKAEIISLYGGSEDREKQGQLVITTTHQLLRYHQAFDIIIIDEVDAFPYSIDEALNFAVQRAKKLISSTIFLTATPNNEMKNQVLAKQLEDIRIPQRHHGHPMPVPELKWLGSWKKHLSSEKLPSVFTHFLQNQLSHKRQTLIFVPSIKVLTQLTQLIKPIVTSVESVHSEDPERKEKLIKFRRKDVSFMVTTTILERGITIPSLDVAVFAAESWIFTESALVQIAGRVGRSRDDPTGDILFFHYGKTKAIKDALRHIKAMNKLAGF